jgi:hypothetical protein
VKKLLMLLLIFGFVFGTAVTTVGCGSTSTTKKEEKKKDDK